MELQNGVNGIVRRRWDTQRASKGAHLAGKPIKLQTPAVFEIVCHRSLPTGLAQRTFEGRQSMSAFGGKAGIAWTRNKDSINFDITFSRPLWLLCKINPSVTKKLPWQN
jgi:hypothetical protein